MPAKTRSSSSKQGSSALRKSNQSKSPSRGMTRQEAGRLGAEARWGREEGNGQGRSRQGQSSRSEAGRRGAEARWGREEGNGQGRSRQGQSSRSEAGRRGAEARWGREEGNGQERSRQGQSSRSEAGRRGAEARWGQYENDYGHQLEQGNRQRNRQDFWEDYETNSNNDRGYWNQSEIGPGSKTQWIYEEDEEEENSINAKQGRRNRSQSGSKYGGASYLWNQDEDEEDYEIEDTYFWDYSNRY